MVHVGSSFLLDFSPDLIDYCCQQPEKCIYCESGILEGVVDCQPTMSLSTLFPCKKIRRSLRLETRDAIEFRKKIQQGPLGYLEVLPLELKFELFSYLSINDLSKLTITSKSVRNVVEIYRCSKSAKQIKIDLEPHKERTKEEHEQYLQYYNRLGLLLKRSSCLYATKERLRMVEQCMFQHMCMVSKCCCDTDRCYSLVYFGMFLKVILSGWDDMECHRAYIMLANSVHTNVMRYLGLIVKSKPGLYSTLEMHVRLFLRRVFLDPYERIDDRGMWLNKILSGWPMVHQAKILYLLYGPANGGEIQWEEMCENTAANDHQLYGCFGELGSAFQILYFTHEWTDDNIISVFDEITCIPEEWLAENIASLLFTSSYDITFKVLASKAVNGRLHDIATAITSLCLVYTKINKGVSQIITLIKQICKVLETLAERELFLNEIVHAFKAVVMDLYEFDNPDEDRASDMTFMLTAQAEFMKELINLSLMSRD